MKESADQDNRNRILTIITLVPAGRVATYGQIAQLAGLPNNARQVGSILKSFSSPEIPWFRIVNSKGEISERRSETSQSKQREILEGEGVRFTESNRVDLTQYLWKPS